MVETTHPMASATGSDATNTSKCATSTHAEVSASSTDVVDPPPPRATASWPLSNVPDNIVYCTRIRCSNSGRAPQLAPLVSEGDDPVLPRKRTNSLLLAAIASLVPSETPGFGREPREPPRTRRR